MRRVLVTGCGRAGTQYTARLLAALGFRVGHEEIYRCTIPPLSPAELESYWQDKDAEISWLAAPYIVSQPKSTVIWHQPVVGDYIRHYLGGCGNGSDLERCVRYVFEWNKRVEHDVAHRGSWSHGYCRYRVEDLTPDRLGCMLARAGWSFTDEQLQVAFTSIPLGTGGCNPKEHIDLSWDQIVRTPLGWNLFGMAKHYGYNPEIVA